jgi:phosphatidylcholine synthase
MRDDLAPPAAPGTPAFPLGLRLAGYAVHLYTASGSVLALLIVVAAVEGHPTTALWLGLATLFIDGTDGMLARRARVKETIPWFDGALLDNIVDYLTYVFAPVVLLWTTHRLPTGVWGWLLAALPLLASSYQFCRVDAKTDDHFFLGFPSYWNIVAFYVIVLDLGIPATTALLVICAIGVFVPVRYLYPSRSMVFWKLTMALAVVWLITYGLLLFEVPHPNPIVVALSLAYVAYYLAVSGWMTLRSAHGRRSAERSAQGSVQAGQPG